MEKQLKFPNSLKLLKEEITTVMPSCNNVGADLIIAILKNSNKFGRQFRSIKNYLKKILFKLLKYAKQEKIDSEYIFEFVAMTKINTIYPECRFSELSFGEALRELANNIACLIYDALPLWDYFDYRSIFSNDAMFVTIVEMFDLTVTIYRLTFL